MKKRILCGLMSVLFVLGVIPVGVLAEDNFEKKASGALVNKVSGIAANEEMPNSYVQIDYPKNKTIFYKGEVVKYKTHGTNCYFNNGNQQVFGTVLDYKNECKREMICNHEECFMDEEHCPHVNEDICPCLQEVLEKLAEYEDLEERRKLPCNWVSEETPPETPCYVLLSFDNFSMPLIGRWEENEEGGAFYIGDDEESCISQDLIVNGWMPLPEPYREDEREELKWGYPEEKAGADALDAGMAADITQAIEYFEDELSQMKVFAEMVTFREEEKKSVETALKVLRGITENGKGQQGNQCATSHR